MKTYQENYIYKVVDIVYLYITFIYLDYLGHTYVEIERCFYGLFGEFFRQVCPPIKMIKNKLFDEKQLKKNKKVYVNLK